MTRRGVPGRTALLTGATGGLGPVLARSLSERQLRLALSARGEADLITVRDGLDHDGHAAVPADLSDPAERAALVARAEKEVGPLDIVIHNAALDACASFDQLTLDEIQRVVETNLTAPMDLVRHTLPGMLERGQGHHVFVSSLSGYAGTAFQAPYAATKAALVGLARSLRAEYLHTPIKFSIVAPGSIANTGMFGRGQDAGITVPRAMRLTTPPAIADAVLRALETGRPESFVYPGPVRPLLGLGLFAPSASDRLNERLGIGRLFEPMARSRGRSSSGGSAAG